jgi:NAD(P)-dependent dehydrogenase (short-subunit alcohol dehydrogenase family)
MALLRERLLAGRAIVLAGGVAEAVSAELSAFGARVETMPEEVKASVADDGVGEWAGTVAPLHALVFDAALAFDNGGPDGLTTALEQAWMAVREVATGALIPDEGPSKIVLVAPRPDAGSMAGAACAGLESLARTLSVEWARYQITTVAVAPGTATEDQYLATLVAFLCSSGGEYLSGCRLDLGAVGSSPSPAAQGKSSNASQ